MCPVIKGVAASLGRQTLLLLLQALSLARAAPGLLLGFCGHAHDAERLPIAGDIPVQAQHHRFGVPLVGLDLLAILVPIPGPDHVVGNAPLLELPMQTVAKRARLVTTVNLLGQRRLFLGPLQKLSRAEPLWRLGRTAID